MAEEVVGVDDKAFRIRFPVPKRCQEIRQIKIEYVNQPFFTVFWIEKHKKCRVKRQCGQPNVNLRQVPAQVNE